MRTDQRSGYRTIHPVLVVIPILCWVAALVGDLIYTYSTLLTRPSGGVDFWYWFSYEAIFGGVTTGCIAASAGVLDYFSGNMSDQSRDDATMHMVLNLGAIILSTINLGYRLTYTTRAEINPEHWWLAFALELATLGLVAISAFLGIRAAKREKVYVTPRPADQSPARR